MAPTSLYATAAERRFAETFARYLFLNPFEPAASGELRTQLLAIDLGTQGTQDEHRPPIETDRPDIARLTAYVEHRLYRLQERLREGAIPANYDEQRWFESLILGALFYRHFENRQPLVEAGDGTGRVPSYLPFARDLAQWTSVPFKFSPFLQRPEHMFAVFFQIRRSFELIVQLVQGESRPITRLRAEIWHSIFPHELALYGSLLYDRMQDVTTLIHGPSGTGKDLVAMAIGLSRYIPFDSRRERFAEPLAGAFHPINLSAMPLDLVESEMFGHAAGAFTGAAKDRQGWFEKCGPGHAVFLDEIGELNLSVQVKLLRVLQNREFFRVGETQQRLFSGKVIAATNRDLGREIAAGRFRQDLFYRLCSDLITTPSLREQLDDSPDELPRLVRIIAARCLGERAWPEQVDWLSRLTVSWIESSPALGLFYDWPGNFRELEQCVRNIMVRGRYHPTSVPSPALPTVSDTAVSTSRLLAVSADGSALDHFLRRVRATDLTFDELLNHYCSLVFARSEHLTAAARRLQKHRATIQSRISPELVRQFQSGTSAP